MTSVVRCDPVSGAELKPDTLGQVFTPERLVTDMLALRQNHGRILEPSCGSGAFSSRLRACGQPVVAVELDPAHAPEYAWVGDFFDYPLTERFDTIIGNPPYVRFQDIAPESRQKLEMTLFDQRSNLYLFFIEKCVRHLNPGGELIFVVPRGLFKATAAKKLNHWLFQEGSFTHFWETGDDRLFQDASPPCCVFRFVKGRTDRTMADGRIGVEHQGQVSFLPAAGPTVPLSTFFTVAVGGVSGADALFTHPEGVLSVVCSATVRTGELRRMLDASQAQRLLLPYKTELLARRVRRFTEANWWEWGRTWPESTAPRLYVNCKTRHAAPFFTSPATAFDGSVLGLFPTGSHPDLPRLAAVLNTVDWLALGFGADGRLEFTQRSLENALIPAATAEHLRDAMMG